ncbi:MAG: 50S ribosomal protein L25 [Elusimicrobiota bacterium]|jgi:large subunit ribosomal protein L25
MAEFELKVNIRSGKSTKKSLTDLRKDYLVPGIVYGGKGTNIQVTVSEKELLGALKQGGKNVLLHLKHDQGEDTVIIKALQRHVISSRPIHADFQRVSMTEKIEVRVKLVIIGEAPGVKLQGGILEHVLREFRVRALPNAIPQSIEVDIKALNLGDIIHVGEVAIPAGIEVLDDAQQMVVHVVAPTELEEKPAAEGEAGAAEPELLAVKGKKEEGEDGEAKPAGKGDAKPAAGKGDAKPAAGKADAKPAGGKEGKK